MIDRKLVHFSKKGTGIAYSDLHQAHSENLNGRVMNKFGILSLISHLSGFGFESSSCKHEGFIGGYNMTLPVQTDLHITKLFNF